MIATFMLCTNLSHWMLKMPTKYYFYKYNTVFNLDALRC